MLKYQNEIDKIWEMMYEEIHEDWMDEKNKKEYKEMICNLFNLSDEELKSQIKIGVNNGYLIDLQMKLIKAVLLKEKESKFKNNVVEYMNKDKNLEGVDIQEVQMIMGLMDEAISLKKRVNRR